MTMTLTMKKFLVILLLAMAVRCFGAVGDTEYSGDLLPSVTDTYSLGSNLLKWEDIFANGDISAGTFTGDGSALTGIAAGTGGVINTGSTTIGADSDSDDVGILVLQTRGATRLTVANDGGIAIAGTITSGVWNGTAIDISDYTNLAAGTNITLLGDTLNVDDAFLINSGSDTMLGTLTSNGVTITTGNALTVGTTRWDDGSDNIEGNILADDSVDDDALDFTSITLADFTVDIASTDLTDTADILYETELDTFSELQAQIVDKTLTNEEDSATIDPAWIFTSGITGPVTGDVTGDLTGNADTATLLATARAFSVSGDVATATGVNFNGAGAVDLEVSFAAGVIVNADVNDSAGISADKLTDGATNAIPTLTQETNWDTHLSSDGSDHGFIDQDMTSGSSPVLVNTNMTGNISVWTNDSGYLDTESSQDVTGGMVSGNTETLIAVTYDDPGGKLNFVIDEAGIDHDSLTNFTATEHFIQSAITQTGIITIGTWRGTDIDIGDYTNLAGGINLTLTNDTLHLDNPVLTDVTGDVVGDLTGNADTATNVEDADFGDVSVSGGVWSLDTDSVADNEIDYTNVTLADFTDDVGYLKADGSVDLTADWVISANSITLTNGTLTAGKVIADSVALKPSVTVTVASSTSLGKNTADYVCDGTADNVQIQAAIDSLSGAGVIKLLEGTFTLAAAIDVGHDDDGVHLEGSGKGVTIIDGALADNIPYIELHADTAETLSYVKLSGFTIDATSHLASTGFPGMIWHQEAGAIEHLEISDIEINTANNKNGGIMFLNAAGTNKYIRIFNTDITASGIQLYGIGIFKNTENLWIENNCVFVPHTSSYNTIAVYADSKYFHVNDNELIGGGHTPIAVSPGTYGEIIGNVVNGSGVANEGGIEIEWKTDHYGTETSHHVVVSGNIVFNANWGIYVHRRDTGAIAPHDIIITGNNVSDCTVGIRIEEGTDITVYGNDYENNTTDFSKGGSTTMKALEVESSINVDGTLTSDDLTGVYTALSLGGEKVSSSELTEGNGNWTYGGDWEDSVEQADAANHTQIGFAGTDTLTATMLTAVEIGVTYRVTAEFDSLTVTNGIVILSLGGVGKEPSLGANSWDITATSTAALTIVVDSFGAQNTDVILDTVSVKEIIPASVTDIEIGNAVSGVYSDTYINKDGGDIFLVGDTYIGDGTNQAVISSGGVMTLEGTAKRVLTLRPSLDYTTVTAQGKPTRVTYGAYQGYSLPIYNTDDEEMFFNVNVPGRWDETSDIQMDILVALSGVEDVNDDFNLQVSWANSELGEPILNTTTDVPEETNLLTGRVAAYDTYEVTFAIDYNADVGNLIESHDDLAIRLRRLAVAGTEIAGEVIVMDYHLHFTVDKMFKAPE